MYKILNTDKHNNIIYKVWSFNFCPNLSPSLLKTSVQIKQLKRFISVGVKATKPNKKVNERYTHQFY